MLRKLIMTLILATGLVGAAYADSTNPYIYKRSSSLAFDELYESMKSHLEEARYWVIFEPNMGRNLAHNAERWGDNYNRSGLDEIRSMVFCNPWYANEVSNLDPDMLAFCPLSLTMIAKQGKTTVLFEKPSVVAKGSPAEDLMWEIESDIINIIDNVMSPSN